MTAGTPAAHPPLLLVPTVGADCRAVVAALTALAAAHGRTVEVVPPHRLAAALAERPDAPVAILSVPPRRAAEEAMRRGLPPSAAVAAHAAEAALLKDTAEAALLKDAAEAALPEEAAEATPFGEAAAAVRVGTSAADALPRQMAATGRPGDAPSGRGVAGHRGRLRRVDLAALEADGAGLAALLGLPSGAAPAAPAPAPADPVLGLLATLAAAPAPGVAADALDAAFHHARALREAAAEAALLRAEADRRHLAGTERGRMEAAIAALAAERDRLEGEVARLRDALAAASATRPRLHTVTAAALAHPAFWDLERHGEREFRWLGREAEALVATAVPRRSAVRVDVFVEMAISPAALEGLAVGFDDAAPDEVSVFAAGRGHVVSALFPGEPDAHPLARRRLRLRAGHRAGPSPGGDPRTLAVAIGRIVMEEADEVAAAVEAEAAPPLREILLAGLLHPAFHGSERRADGLPFRWMGAQGRATIPLRLRPGTVRVDVDLAMAVSPETVAALAIGLDGVEAATAVAPDGAGGARVSALFHLAAASATAGAPAGNEEAGAPAGNEEAGAPAGGEAVPGGGERLVRLHLAAPVRPGVSGGDPRPLSVAVHAIRVATVEDPDALPPDAPLPPDLLPATVPPRPAARATLGAERSLAGPAFHGLERAGDRPFRWMGREERAELPLPLAIPPGRPVCVTADIAVAVDEAAVSGLAVLLDGRPPEEVVVERRPGGGYLASALFPPSEPPADGAPRLTLVAGVRTDLSARGDPRTLAVGLARIDVDVL